MHILIHLKLTGSKNSSPVLMFVEVAAISQKQCASYYGSTIVNSKVICVREKRSAGICSVSTGLPPINLAF